jgi:carboxypeptidase Taq
MPKSNTEINELKKRLLEIRHLTSALAVLSYDQEVFMPRKGTARRAETLAHLSGIVHKTFTSIDNDNLLTNLKKQVEEREIVGDDAIIVSETWRDFYRQKKLPESFVRELTEVQAKSQEVWVEARKKSDFSLFEPWLTKIVELKRKEATYVGYKNSPYDALIDTYEPGMTTEETSMILNDLKDFLVPFIAKIKKSKVKIDSKKILGNFPLPEQIEFNTFIAQKMGYDLDAGRIDVSTHPFTNHFHQSDVRFTTRYDVKNILYALGSTIHEAGHALYEQGIKDEHFGTPLGESISLGIHESQSRMWENMIGKSKSFWKYFYPHVQKRFPKPFKKISLEEFYVIMNKVEPSLIRVESDEVTYNLHIIIRFEIERELIEGTIEVKDLPKIWNDKVKSYLGIKVPKDSLGVLQDVHWSFGLFGYFPTYSFGNLYAAQFYDAMKQDIPDLEKKISQGKLEVAREWLRKNIHEHGKRYTAGGLVEAITTRALTSRHFREYLTQKYSEIYNLI